MAWTGKIPLALSICIQFLPKFRRPFSSRPRCNFLNRACKPVAISTWRRETSKRKIRIEIVDVNWSLRTPWWKRCSAVNFSYCFLNRWSSTEAMRILEVIRFLLFQAALCLLANAAGWSFSSFPSWRLQDSRIFCVSSGHMRFPDARISTLLALHASSCPCLESSRFPWFARPLPPIYEKKTRLFCSLLFSLTGYSTLRGFTPYISCVGMCRLRG